MSQIIGAECLSQWYRADFEVDGFQYSTAEHYMMAEKARLFCDEKSRTKILSAKSPGEAKALGRLVEGFHEHEWREHRFTIVVSGNLHKFQQNPKLKDYLLRTQNRVLVEASPYDRIWGIGLAADHTNVEEPSHWKGDNLLGFALMEVRSLLSEMTLPTC